MSNCDSVGRIGRVPLEILAQRASNVIRGYAGPRAVCVAPDGEVTIELFDHAIPDEVIGNFDKTAGWPALDRLIRDELAAVAVARRRTR